MARGGSGAKAPPLAARPNLTGWLASLDLPEVYPKVLVCCFVLLTQGEEDGRTAHGKRTGFSPGAAASHGSRTRVPRIMSFSGLLVLRGALFPLLFFPFLKSDISSV